MRDEALPQEFITTIKTGWWTTCLEVLPAKEFALGYTRTTIHQNEAERGAARALFFFRQALFCVSRAHLVVDSHIPVALECRPQAANRARGGPSNLLRLSRRCWGYIPGQHPILQSIALTNHDR